MIVKLFKNPITRKRLSRFREVRRAYYSLWILMILYAVSLCSELICNDQPLYLRCNGESYFPVFRFYPEDAFLHNGRKTRPDYKKIRQDIRFTGNPDNMMLFPIIPYSPYESIEPSALEVSDEIIVKLSPVPAIGKADIDKDLRIVRAVSLGVLIGKNDQELTGLSLKDFVHIPESLHTAIQLRFDNQEAPSVAVNEKLSGKSIEMSLSEYFPRSDTPKTVRLTLTLKDEEKQTRLKLIFDSHGNLVRDSHAIWQDLADKETIIGNVRKRSVSPVDSIMIGIRKTLYHAEFIKEDVRFPFKPVKGHFMGIDDSGRDVFARILYGLRTSMSFGLVLVICSMGLGIIAGAIQGYYGGIIDMTAQRLIEIWSALPFLYIMILMGSVYGRSFSLLLFCYGIFNWIGISYYIRAEFLRLRRQPFVEAARCMGLSSAKIIFRHILPNALVPVITFFPFSLVGAIGSLAALDYLGFGLPAPTPSWGELLFQAQQYRWAWWLILYPSLALFVVMLLGVFVGDGIRNAYDPKRYTRLE